MYVILAFLIVLFAHHQLVVVVRLATLLKVEFVLFAAVNTPIAPLAIRQIVQHVKVDTF